MAIELSNGNYLLTGTRNGKVVSRQVTIKQCDGTDLFWVKDAEGKSFFGTSTGYYRSGSGGALITSYRAALLLTDVRFEKL